MKYLVNFSCSLYGEMANRPTDWQSFPLEFSESFPSLQASASTAKLANLYTSSNLTLTALSFSNKSDSLSNIADRKEELKCREE